jgi:outer membrane receptor protein involved in Fe transport
VPEVPAVVAQFGDDVEYIQREERELEEWAVFGELSYQFTDQFQVTFGARYFDVEDDFTTAIGFPLLNQILGIDPDDPGEQIWLNSTRAKESFDDLIFKVNTSYDVNDETMVYFTFSEGYRQGGSNAIADCDALPVLTTNVVCGSAEQLGYEPDETDNYEIGVRNQFLDGRMTLNTAVYYVSWDKVQVGDVSASGGFPILVNGDDAESRGLELEFSWQIDDNWAVRGSYAYTDAELGNDDDLLAEGTAQKGDRLPGTPKHQGTAFVNFSQDFSRDLTLDVSYGLTAQSNVLTKLGRGGNCCRPFDGETDFVNPGPGESLSGFDVHYATVSLSGERWVARLYANNLWNEEQVTGVRADRSLIGRADGGFDPTVQYAYRRYFNYVLTPREIGLDLRYRFGDVD